MMKGLGTLRFLFCEVGVQGVNRASWGAGGEPGGGRGFRVAPEGLRGSAIPSAPPVQD